MLNPELVAKLLLSPLNDPKASILKIFPDKPIIGTSGIFLPLYMDHRELQSYPETRRKLTFLMLEEIEALNLHPDGLAAVANSGIDHTARLAELMNLPMVTVLKEAKIHGTKQMLNGIIETGANYLVIDDVFNTGKSVFAAVRNLRQAEVNVTDALCITTYGFPSTLRGFVDLGVRPTFLTDLPTVLRIAYNSQQIDLPTLRKLQLWHQSHCEES